MTDATVTAFAVVFGVFVVASLVLIVLVLRFTFQRVAAAREAWMAGRPADGDEESDRPLTALVLAGGGTRGAVQIGMLQVLAEHGFVPDRIYGTSVGAVNGAGFASDATPEGVERMARIWTALSRDDVYPQGRLHGPWLYFQQRDAVYSNSGLRRIIEEGVSFNRLEDAPIPIEVVATSLVDGRERWFTYGPTVEAILASAALPAIFPPVEIDGERYMDGGVVNNVPIRRAIDAGAKRIVVLMCSPPVFEPTQARRPIEAVLNALFIAVHARFARDMAQLPPHVEVMLCTVGALADDGRGFGDFSSTAELIAEGRREAAEVVRRYGLGRPSAGSNSAADPAGTERAGTARAGTAPAETEPAGTAPPGTAPPGTAPAGTAPAGSGVVSGEVQETESGATPVPTSEPMAEATATDDVPRTGPASRRRLGGRWSQGRGRPVDATPATPPSEVAAGTGPPDADASPIREDPAVSAAGTPTGPPAAVVPGGEGPGPSVHPDPRT
jgi:NTE family protein